MSLDGVWDSVVNSPMGEQRSIVTLKEENGVVTGQSEPIDGGAPTLLLNGKINGDKVTWAINITKPMAMKVDFELTLTGDTLEGVAKPGMFGKFPARATKR